MKISETKKIDGISPGRATGIRGTKFKRESETFTIVYITDQLHFNEKITLLRMLAESAKDYSHTGTTFQNLASAVGGGDKDKFTILYEKDEQKNLLDEIFGTEKPIGINDLSSWDCCEIGVKLCQVL
jgi:hypothetical protein